MSRRERRLMTESHDSVLNDSVNLDVRQTLHKIMAGQNHGSSRYGSISDLGLRPSAFGFRFPSLPAFLKISVDPLPRPYRVLDFDLVIHLFDAGQAGDAVVDALTGVLIRRVPA
jgi:hypothetical protein